MLRSVEQGRTVGHDHIVEDQAPHHIAFSFRHLSALQHGDTGQRFEVIIDQSLASDRVDLTVGDQAVGFLAIHQLAALELPVLPDLAQGAATRIQLRPIDGLEVGGCDAPTEACEGPRCRLITAPQALVRNVSQDSGEVAGALHGHGGDGLFGHAIGVDTVSRQMGPSHLQQGHVGEGLGSIIQRTGYRIESVHKSDGHGDIHLRRAASDDTHARYWLLRGGPTRHNIERL